MNLKPLPGHAVIEMFGAYRADGPIQIPERYRTKRSYWGRVVSISQSAQDRTNWHGIDLVGMVVLVEKHSGRRVIDNKYVYPTSDIVLAVEKALEGQIVLDTSTAGAPERCRWCGAAKEGTENAIMLINGICPRCHKNANGEYVDPDAVTANDDDVRRFDNLTKRGPSA